MKKKLTVAALLICFMTIIIAVSTNTLGDKSQKKDKLKIVTSFYPMYIAAQNVVKDVESVELVNFTQPQTGCLHNYQLTPQDMISLENADILIINGGGMEGFLEDIVKQYPKLNIINASEGIEFLEGCEHEHEHEHEHENEKHEHEYNAHVWVSISKYIQQIKNITKDLSGYDEANKEKYEKNEAEYILQLENLKETMNTELKDIKGENIVIFHDSFQYLADELGLNVKHVVVMEEDTSLSAGEIAEIVEEIKEYNIKVMFTEEQYSEQIAATVAKETQARVYVLNSCVRGEMDSQAYINAMKSNIEILKEAFKNE